MSGWAWLAVSGGFTRHLIAFHGIAAIFFIWLDRRAPVARKG